MSLLLSCVVVSGCFSPKSDGENVALFVLRSTCLDRQPGRRSAVENAILDDDTTDDDDEEVEEEEKEEEKRIEDIVRDEV